MMNKMISKSADGVAGIQNWWAEKKLDIKNECLFSEGKSFLPHDEMSPMQSTYHRGGWLIPQDWQPPRVSVLVTAAGMTRTQLW